MIAAFFMLVSPAVGEEVCGKHGDMVAQLKARYGEYRQASAITSGGWILEIFATGDGKTWTTLLTSPMGKTCVNGSGQTWQLHSSEPEKTAI